MIENTRPPMVSVAVREPFVVLVAVEYCTVPLPTPLAPVLIVSHAADDVADQEHDAPVETATEPAAASEPADTLVGEIVMSHVPA